MSSLNCIIIICALWTTVLSLDLPTPVEIFRSRPLFSSLGEKAQTLGQIDPLLYIFWNDGHGDREASVSLSHYSRADVVPLPSTSKEIYVIIHGWMQFWPRYWMYWIKDELITKGHSVILVRWTEGSKFPLYGQSAVNTEVVGNALAQYLSLMANTYPKSVLGGVTFVGFSLGAHVAGFASSRLTYPIYTRIYGLDPAGYKFQGEPLSKRLSKDDAHEVYVLHTNAGSGTIFGPIRNTLGIAEPIGHWDFYANGGTRQPGCQTTQLTSRLAQTQRATSLAARHKVDQALAVNYRLYCDHHRAIFLFLSMLRDSESCQMTAFACSSAEKWARGECFACDKVYCANMGYGVSNNLRNVPHGSYYFNTVSRNNGDHNQSLCTHQYMVTLVADQALSGSILVAFKDKSSRWIYVRFMSQEDYVPAHGTYQTLLSMPFTVPKDVSTIRVSYERATRVMIRQGPSIWRITHLSVKNERGAIYSYHGNPAVTMRDMTTHQIPLQKRVITDGEVHNILNFLKEE